jgi:sialate O-acetylesterase
MKKIVFFFFLYTMAAGSPAAFAGIRLPAVISSNMVLQQQSAATLWGWADPGEKIMVTASWKGLTDSVVTPSDGKWKTTISTPVAGGPYTITLKGWNTIVLENILVGEVWICSGQSNMEWSSYSNNRQIIDELPKSGNSNIRLFHIPRTTSAYPQDNCEGSWEACGPETLKGFSAIGYFFGKKLQGQLNVPVGLIEAAWGGTPVETWTPAGIIENDPVMKPAAAKLPATPWGPHLPGVIYNAMIAPVVNYAVAGAIWYQGESNVGIAPAYQTTFSAMIGAWRKAFGRDFPFYYVQIAPYNYGNKNEGALLREQQTKTLSYPNTGMVVITDLVDNTNDIHPQNKYDVAGRLANLALAEAYKQNIVAWKSPLFKRMETIGNKAILFFDNAPNGFVTKGNAGPTEFYIAGDDRVFLPADVKIEKDRIIVSHKQVPAPAAVRFAFSNTAISNLFSREGLPVAPFRTDNWDTAH